MNTILELVSVSRTYRQGGVWGKGQTVHAVDNVSLAVAPGQCLAVVGASGSGKSTLGRILLGLEKPDTGSVLFRGEELWGLRGDRAREARRASQVVFQNSHGAVNPRCTALQSIGEPLRNFDRLPKRQLRDKVAELLIQVGLSPDDMEKYPHQFSGGELQRVCLARALAPRPDLVVLDEAVSSLDMVNQDRIVRLLADIQKDSGCAYVFISHDLRIVCRLADSVVVMEHGRLAGCIENLDNASMGDLECVRFLTESVLPSEPSRTG